MNFERASHGICVFKGLIYVCGGKKSDSSLMDTFEVYYPESDEWVLLPPCEFPTVRTLLVGFTTQEKEDYIYKIGGFGTRGNSIY